MRHEAHITAIIPAFNEEDAIAEVIRALPEWVDACVVGDNGSTDATAERARQAGAVVVHEPRRGYGSACLAALAQAGETDVFLFLDGDHSDFPEEAHRLVDPIVAGEADLVIGSRVRGGAEPGALTPQARFGNWLATKLIRWIWGVAYTDLGPFRAVRRDALELLAMTDPDFGWTVEMQTKAAARRLPSLEVPVPYRKRIGASKISGTLSGSARAGVKILGTILRMSLRRRAQAPGDVLVLFTRFPTPGQAKTRLVPALGEKGAASLHRQLTEAVVKIVDFYHNLRPQTRLEIRHDGAGPTPMRAWLGDSRRYRPQGEGDLGQRLAHAAKQHFAGGAQRVVFIGSDCIALTPELLGAAFRRLEEHDVVLGPALDGGYYLIGLHRRAARQALPHLFSGIAWGGGQVLAQTKVKAQEKGLRLSELQPLPDIDRPEDLDGIRDRFLLPAAPRRKAPGS